MTPAQSQTPDSAPGLDQDLLRLRELAEVAYERWLVENDGFPIGADEYWLAAFTAGHAEASSAAQSSEARAVRAEREREELRLAICGGEDAPGHNDSLSHETVLGVLRDNYSSWRRDGELAWDGETATSWKARAEAAESELASLKERVEGVVKALEAEASHMNRSGIADDGAPDAEFHGGRMNGKAEAAKRIRAALASLNTAGGEGK